MTIDHIGVLISNTPIWFRWIGRLAYPLFAFCCVQAFLHTRSKQRYLLRLYFWNIIMTIFITCLNVNYVTNDWQHNKLSNNIFSTLFQLALLIYIIDIVTSQKRNNKKIIFIYILYQFFMVCGMYAAVALFMKEWWMEDVAKYIFCSIFWNEGGIFFVLLGVIFYLPYAKIKDFNKNGINFQKRCNCKCVIYYLIFVCFYLLIDIFNILTRIFYEISSFSNSAIEEIFMFLFQILGFDMKKFTTFTSASAEYIFYENFQWMMIFAAPLLLFYNEKKGSGIKYFFYFYYPAHIIFLFFLGNLS